MSAKGSRARREQRKALLIIGSIFLAIVLLIGGGIFAAVSNYKSKQRAAKEAEEAAKEKQEVVAIEAPDEVTEEVAEEPEEIEEPSEDSEALVDAEEEEADDEEADVEEPEAEEEVYSVPKDEKAVAWADEQLGDMSLEAKVAQLFIITPEALTGHGGVVGEAKEKTRNALKSYPVGGVIYYDKNIGSVSQVQALLGNTQKYAMDQSGIPVFLAVDEEGGQVARVGNYRAMKAEKVEDMAKIGEGGVAGEALQAGEIIGTYLHDLGFNLDFAPVADVLLDSSNKQMNRRCFGEAPDLVWEMDEQFLKGINNHQVAGCLKHFPGYAITSKDPYQNGASVDMSLDELKQYAFKPFEKGCKSGVEMMMVGQTILTQVSDDNLPCCLSSDVVSGIIRSEYGYDGVLITDVMNKGTVGSYDSADSAVKAISAGMDMLLTPKDFKKTYKGVLDAVADGTLTEERIDESVRRILTMKYRYKE